VKDGREAGIDLELAESLGQEDTTPEVRHTACWVGIPGRAENREVRNAVGHRDHNIRGTVAAEGAVAAVAEDIRVLAVEVAEIG
jgi:hypothetical protein